MCMENCFVVVYPSCILNGSEIICQYQQIYPSNYSTFNVLQKTDILSNVLQTYRLLLYTMHAVMYSNLQFTLFNYISFFLKTMYF